MKKHRKKGFTLIEVLAALGIIIVLTLTLVITIRAQLQKANEENLKSVAAAMNMQIAVAYEQVGRIDSNFTTTESLREAGIITDEQAKQAADMKLTAGPPPEYTVK
jgi:competence protein ComGC